MKLSSFNYGNRWFCILLSLPGLAGCYLPKTEKPDPEFIRKQAERLAYDLENPDRKISLHFDLREISGLTLVEEGKLGCVQDESGRVYLYNPDSEKIQRNIKFGSSGDYEGIEFAGGRMYVLENEGTLHRFDTISDSAGPAEVETINTPLTAENNTEGLGFLRSSNKLLIACKGDAGIKDNKVKGKAVYAYNLAENRFEEKPFLTISKGDITKFIKKHPENYKIEKAPDFKPSGIAVHPKTNKIYILNSIGKMLIIVDQKGKIEDLAILNPGIFRQPEGICFAPNGDLYIASESGGGGGALLGRGYILTFDYLQ